MSTTHTELVEAGIRLAVAMEAYDPEDHETHGRRWSGMSEPSRDRPAGETAKEALARLGPLISECLAKVETYVSGFSCENCGAALPDDDERYCEMCYEREIEASP